jgi:hypothetical protein
MMMIYLLDTQHLHHREAGSMADPVDAVVGRVLHF